MDTWEKSVAHMLGVFSENTQTGRTGFSGMGGVAKTA